MEPRRKRPHEAADATGTAVFNVGGRHFEVLRQTIEARPATLLASLLEDIGTDGERPIFVDANADRFAHILDWYRYDEMYVAEGGPLGGIIRDARFFLLPDSVTINGASHDIRLGATNAANAADEAVVSAVTKHWPSFEKCMDSVVAEIQAGLESIGANAASEQGPPAADGKWAAGEIAEDASLFVTSLVLWDSCNNKRLGWERLDVCSMARCRVLQGELAKRGYDCRISDRSPDPDFSDYYGDDHCLFLNVFWRCNGGSGGRRRAAPAEAQAL